MKNRLKGGLLEFYRSFNTLQNFGEVISFYVKTSIYRTRRNHY